MLAAYPRMIKPFSAANSLENHPAAAYRDARVAFVSPSRARSWRSQAVFKEFTKTFPHTAVFTGFWPGFIRGYEGTFQVRHSRHVRYLTSRGAETDSSPGLAWISPLAVLDLLHFRPEVIFTNGFHLYTVYALIVKAVLGSPVILQWQGVSAETGGTQGSVRLRVRRTMARFLDLAISNTQDGTDYLENMVGILPSKVWHRICEVGDRDSLRAHPSHERVFGSMERPIFLFVGRLVGAKGIGSLLEACSLLLKRGITHFSVALVGDGADREEFRQLARVLGIEPRVHWRGSVPYEEVGAYYQACDVFVLPSLEDTWGVVVLEAMLFGKPILCSRYAGAREMVRDGANGCVFDPHEPAELADCMARFVTQPQLIAKYGRASKEMIEPYTPERSARILEHAVARVLAPQATASPRESAGKSTQVSGSQ